MIFYKAIQYTILDYCIEKIFNQLTRNLSTPKDLGLGLPLELTDIYHGLTVSRIIIQTDTRYGDYSNCTIYDLQFDANGNLRFLTFIVEPKGSGAEVVQYGNLKPNQIWIDS
jgi:hypothetical protein